MLYTATVPSVMIASTADVPEYRCAARNVIYEWNTIHSVSHSTVLMPVGWETLSVVREDTAVVMGAGDVSLRSEWRGLELTA